jgi:hypothetical protein
MNTEFYTANVENYLKDTSPIVSYLVNIDLGFGIALENIIFITNRIKYLRRVIKRLYGCEFPLIRIRDYSKLYHNEISYVILRSQVYAADKADFEEYYSETSVYNQTTFCHSLMKFYHKHFISSVHSYVYNDVAIYNNRI